jgi:hypothetical protein
MSMLVCAAARSAAAAREPSNGSWPTRSKAARRTAAAATVARFIARPKSAATLPGHQIIYRAAWYSTERPKPPAQYVRLDGESEARFAGYRSPDGRAGVLRAVGNEPNETFRFNTTRNPLPQGDRVSH